MHLVFVFLVMQLDDAYFMKQAMVEAEKAFSADEVPVGAVVVVDSDDHVDVVIALSQNLIEASRNLNEKFDAAYVQQRRRIEREIVVFGGLYIAFVLLVIEFHNLLVCLFYFDHVDLEDMPLN